MARWGLQKGRKENVPSTRGTSSAVFCNDDDITCCGVFATVAVSEVNAEWAV